MTQALADYVWRRLGFALGPYGDRMQRVSVGVGFENGSRGRMHKFCRIQVHLNGAPVAVVEDVGADLYATVDRAAERVGGVVGRHLDRARPVRDPARTGSRPARRRHEFRETTRGHEDIE